MNTLITFLTRAFVQAIPLLFGSTGEILTEKSGHLNLGIPGIMYVGGISGVIGSFLYEQSVGPENIKYLPAILIPLCCSLLGSLCMGLIYSFLTVTLRVRLVYYQEVFGHVFLFNRAHFVYRYHL